MRHPSREDGVLELLLLALMADDVLPHGLIIYHVRTPGNADISSVRQEPLTLPSHPRYGKSRELMRKAIPACGVMSCFLPLWNTTRASMPLSVCAAHEAKTGLDPKSLEACLWKCVYRLGYA